MRGVPRLPHEGNVIHYHGTPITPNSVLHTLAGRHFCISFARPDNVKICHQIGQSCMLDNGAFSAWTKGRHPDWNKYYAWCERWLEYQTSWAVIPDVIDGDELANDNLIAQWPFKFRGAPVWHLHESLERLERLCDNWPRVCLGSSGQYRSVGTKAWHARMEESMNFVCRKGPAPTWLHLMRGMNLGGSRYPLSSVDSTDVARNHHKPGRVASDMASRWDSLQCPARWASAST